MRKLSLLIVLWAVATLVQAATLERLRAFVRDTQIVVLDEPTSFLDVQAEHEVFNRFRHLAAGRSTILISHRLSTVRKADCIYVLEDGRIAESGRHDELVRRGQAYARLFETQAQSYR